MKIDIICCVSAQMLYLEKSFSKYTGKNALSQSNGRIFILTISPEQIDETASFFACYTNSQKLKVER